MLDQENDEGTLMLIQGKFALLPPGQRMIM